MKSDMCSNLYERLDPRGCEIKSNLSQNEQEIFAISFQGGMEFIVIGRLNFGWYFVQKNKECISPCYHFSKLDDRTFSTMQNIINEIKSGKYKNKKTPKEKIRLIV